MKINILTNKIDWFGKYSGYECLTNYIPGELIRSNINSSERTLIKRIKGKYYQIKKNKFEISTFQLSAGISFIDNIKKNELNHILYLENHLYLFEIYKTNKTNDIIGTIHIPFNRWDKKGLQKLFNLKNSIILYESEVNKFQEYLPKASIKFIRHGVDNSFFKPNRLIPRDRNKILCVGHFLRNFNMLLRVIENLEIEHPGLTFHFIIPEKNRSSPALFTLSKKTNVYFYDNLSDEQMLAYYQSCYLMVMPMEDSGANTAIVQAIACGIPIVTTNNGGITSYGGNSIYPVVENNDDKAMKELINKFLSDESFHARISNSLRVFSLEYLDWNIIAEQHLDYYKELLNNKSNG